MSVFHRKKQSLLLCLFVVLVLAAPLAFAVNEPLEAQAQSLTSLPGEQSSAVFIRFKDLNMNFRKSDDIRQSHGTLGPGSIIQIPSDIAKFNMDGSINLNATMEYWLEYAQYQKEYLGYSHFEAQSWECGDKASCDGIKDDELFFPVKVIKSDNPDIATAGSASYGYLALDYIRNNVHPSRYQTVHTTLENALQMGLDEPSATTPSTVVTEGDASFTGPSEVTTAVVYAPVQPSQVQADHAIMNCSNRSFTRTYQRTSCLRELSLVQRAELVMRDVSTINRWRSSFNLDPRFSVCIAYRESGMNPNARGLSGESGMYQVMDRTGAGALQKTNPVTPGFSQFRYNWRSYRDTMVQSTLAQADLHHSVLLEKAERGGLLAQINQGTTSKDVYRTLARIYNGTGAAARAYSNAIANCYERMKSVARRDGTITNASGLQSALNLAKH